MVDSIFFNIYHLLNIASLNYIISPIVVVVIEVAVKKCFCLWGVNVIFKICTGEHKYIIAMSYSPFICMYFSVLALQAVLKHVWWPMLKQCRQRNL